MLFRLCHLYFGWAAVCRILDSYSAVACAEKQKGWCENGLVFGILALLTLIFNLAAVAAYFTYKAFTVRCQKCGKIQNKDSLYCRYCGAQGVKICTSCGTELKTDDNYCKKCGAKYEEK